MTPATWLSSGGLPRLSPAHPQGFVVPQDHLLCFSNPPAVMPVHRLLEVLCRGYTQPWDGQLPLWVAVLSEQRPHLGPAGLPLPADCGEAGTATQVLLPPSQLPIPKPPSGEAGAQCLLV